ncbi:MAG: hypothetical protein K0Q95_1842 [Bacteroidota bacterium]|jgi:uncharacterized protein (DUF2252 family)|nr:hypothetical protein [Bacteroidota bacterium]
MKNIAGKILKFHELLLPELTAHKYALMNENVYRFFRGTCHLYYETLSKEKNIPGSPAAWICGDLHLENFGSYKGDNRLVYFDLNDFDEAVLAPATWELTRFISSVFIAFESMGIESKKAMNMGQLFLKVYSETLAGGKSFYIEPKTAKGIVKIFLKKASKQRQSELLDKRTIRKNGRLRIVTGKKYFPVDKELRTELCNHMEDWIINNNGRPYNFEVADVAFRRAGLGSLGLKRYLFLLRSVNSHEEYMLVDMKEAISSSLAPYLEIKQPDWKSESERIISIQTRMQNIVPALLSETRFKDANYVIEEMQPMHDSINLKLIKNRYRDIYQVINDMAILTASSHLRSSGRQCSANADELISFGLDTSWQSKIIDIGIAMAEQTKVNHKEFTKGYEEGLYSLHESGAD